MLVKTKRANWLFTAELWTASLFVRSHLTFSLPVCLSVSITNYEDSCFFGWLSQALRVFFRSAGDDQVFHWEITTYKNYVNASYDSLGLIKTHLESVHTHQDLFRFINIWYDGSETKTHDTPIWWDDPSVISFFCPTISLSVRLHVIFADQLTGFISHPENLPPLPRGGSVSSFCFTDWFGYLWIWLLMVFCISLHPWFAIFSTFQVKHPLGYFRQWKQPFFFLN